MTDSAAGREEVLDYEGPEGARLRAEASELAARRSALFDEATAKRNAGDAAAANALVQEAAAVGREITARNTAAAEAIARHNNEAKGKGDDFLDLHGLREAEALALLRQRLARLRAMPAGTVTALELVPGAGHHSAPGRQKLMAAAEAVLKEEQLSYKELTAGSMMVEVVGTREAAAEAQATKSEAATESVKPAPGKAPREEPRESQDVASKAKDKEKKKGIMSNFCSIM